MSTRENIRLIARAPSICDMHFGIMKSELILGTYVGIL